MTTRIDNPALLTMVALPGGTHATVESRDWAVPGYEVCGFETVTVMPDGSSWGIGPEKESDTVFSLHCDAILDVVRQFLKDAQ